MTDQLQLIMVANPPETTGGDAFTIRASDGETVVGRLPDCGVPLEHGSVSRRHAAIRCEHDQWTVHDLGSRHGTYVDGDQLGPDESRPLAAGAHVQVGPFVFRVRIAGPVDRGMMTLAGGGADQAMVSVILPNQRRGLAQQRLDVLIRAAGALSEAPDIEGLAGAVVRAACEGSGAARAVLLQRTQQETDFEVLASHGIESTARGGAQAVSQSLVRSALEGNLAQLTAGTRSFENAVSIVDLGIGSAICAPVRIGATVEAVLYLDTRGREQAFRDDAAAFFEALAGVCGLALANLRRLEVEREQIRLHRDMDAARRAQEMIMPPQSGDVGPIRYASLSVPGRLVAGDLLDVIPLDENRTMLMLGDVSGKGVGAAIMMATAQSYLRASSTTLQDPAALLENLNRHVVDRTSAGTFVTMCLAIVDGATNTLRIADAGHGHCCMVYGGREPCVVDVARQVPIGVMADVSYPVTDLPFEPGSRFLVFSDGLVEQADAAGDMFGMERILEAVAPSTSVEEDVSRLEAALRSHAATSSYTDDLTIASFARI